MNLEMTDLPDMESVRCLAPTHPDGYEVIVEHVGLSKNDVQLWCDEHLPDATVKITGQFAGCDLVTITDG